MDEPAFRRAREAVTPRPCAFEKAVLAGACSCTLAARRNIAEREAVACAAPAAREVCVELRGLLRQNSAFALKLTQVQDPLPHALEMKVECGGLRGLRQALAADAAVPNVVGADAGGGGSEEAADPPVADVQRLVRDCVEKFGSLENLPYSLIVQSVVAHQNRRRRPKQ
jgi:hypothetical protein